MGTQGFHGNTLPNQAMIDKIPSSAQLVEETKIPQRIINTEISAAH